MVPNGLIANLYGPVEGKRHDCALLRESRILEKMVHMHNADGVAMAVYGDPAYVMRDHIYCPFQGAYLTEEEKEFNSSMSKARICVEWGFGKVVQEFAFLEFETTVATSWKVLCSWGFAHKRPNLFIWESHISVLQH